MRPRNRPCPICKDVKAAVWVQMLLEQGLSPRRIARAKPEAGYGFSRPQVVRHVRQCKAPPPEEVTSREPKGAA